MLELIVLGSAHAIPDQNHENTHLALIGQQRRVLIDCAGNPIVRLQQAGINPDSLTDLFLTHFHPDHVSGVPSLLMSMWLLGRRTPLDIYGLHYTLDRVEQLMGFYDWEHWPDFFPVIFHRLPAEPLTLALACDEFRIFSSPVQHLIPTIGLRIENAKTARVLAYSCDTQPCNAVGELAQNADILIHESAGSLTGHTSATQAGEIAARAEVGSLYLIHYNPQEKNLVAEAQTKFFGPVTQAEDFMKLEF
ncbi:MAG TPA: MBL fold metallo-hydrolase [Chloroflexi bacterium]|nr:MBL fold metallo-hydrolase [Chloroflexota bacterium]